MSNNLRDWKVILSTNNYHSVFIKSNENNDSLMLLYKYLEEIMPIEDYVMLIPSYQEKASKDISNYLKKFAPILKSFIDDKSKKTLIAEESVLNVLLKQDKRENFFKFLAKQKKNIILFCNTDYEEYVKNISQPYTYLSLDYDSWKNSVEMFDRFSDIKVAISKTYNPFKNPGVAFKKYVSEKE
jgi:hypothetical protein